MFDEKKISILKKIRGISVRLSVCLSVCLSFRALLAKPKGIIAFSIKILETTYLKYLSKKNV